MSVNRKTVFLDIDGTLVKYQNSLSEMFQEPMEINPMVMEKLVEWREKDYYLVITTARPEGTRHATVKQLSEAGIFYDQIIMGLPRGARVVLNDKKPNGMLTADSFNLERNEGFADVDI